MTDPTPTRAEVEAMIEQLMLNAPAVPLNSRPYDRIMQDAAMMLFALRERAEAAEAMTESLRASSSEWRSLAMTYVADDPLYSSRNLSDTAARRAEAAAWNDAVEAAAQKCDVVFTDHIGDLIRAIGDDIRALRRAAPTEDR